MRHKSGHATVVCRCQRCPPFCSRCCPAIQQSPNRRSYIRPDDLCAGRELRPAKCEGLVNQQRITIRVWRWNQLTVVGKTTTTTATTTSATSSEDVGETSRTAGTAARQTCQRATAADRMYLAAFSSRYPA